MSEIEDVAAERGEIESLVRAEFVKQKVPAAAAKNLKYHNLTAIDVNADGTLVHHAKLPTPDDSRVTWPLPVKKSPTASMPSLMPWPIR